jgi:basic membrane protein A
MKKLLSIILTSVLALSIMLTGCGKPAEKTTDKKTTFPAVKKEELKVGFIYVGPPGDGGYTYAHDQGRLYLEKTLGVKTIAVENVKEEPSAVETVCEQMISQGCQVIIGTSFGFMEGMDKNAKKHPGIIYMHASGSTRETNMSTYFGKIEEPRYLAGIVAGLKTTKNKIGYVAAYPIPECIRGINAFTLGLQTVKPDATVEVVWTNTWYDPAKEQEAANSLIAKGVDIIAQHQDTAGPQIAAEKAGIWSIGNDSDMYSYATKANLTSPMWNWGPFYVSEMQKVIAGTWQSSDYWGSMADGIVKLAPLTPNAPAGAQAAVDKATPNATISKIFAGPLKDQAGTVKVAAGTSMTDAEVWSMNWFVKGVIGNPSAQ